MKRNIILASHATLAKGLKETAEMIVGSMASDIQAFELKQGSHPDTFVDEIKKTFKEDEEYVILTDIYGASVCTAMTSLLAFENVVLFSGMNLNLLLSVLIEYPKKLTKDNIDQIVSDAQTGIRHVEIEVLEEEDF